MQHGAHLLGPRNAIAVSAGNAPTVHAVERNARVALEHFLVVAVTTRCENHCISFNSVFVGAVGHVHALHGIALGDKTCGAIVRSNFTTVIPDKCCQRLDDAGAYRNLFSFLVAQQMPSRVRAGKTRRRREPHAAGVVKPIDGSTRLGHESSQHILVGAPVAIFLNPVHRFIDVDLNPVSNMNIRVHARNSFSNSRCAAQRAVLLEHNNVRAQIGSASTSAYAGHSRSNDNDVARLRPRGIMGGGLSRRISQLFRRGIRRTASNRGRRYRQRPQQGALNESAPRYRRFHCPVLLFSRRLSKAIAYEKV